MPGAVAGCHPPAVAMLVAFAMLAAFCLLVCGRRADVQHEQQQGLLELQRLVQAQGAVISSTALPFALMETWAGLPRAQHGLP
jgi:hypothetical protein